MTLEQLCGDRQGALQAFAKTIAPIENTLAGDKYFGGAQPNYTDYILFGSLQWANVVSGTTFVSRESATAAWFERMLDLFGGYARQALTIREIAAA